MGDHRVHGGGRRQRGACVVEVGDGGASRGGGALGGDVEGGAHPPKATVASSRRPTVPAGPLALTRVGCVDAVDAVDPTGAGEPGGTARPARRAHRRPRPPRPVRPVVRTRRPAWWPPPRRWPWPRPTPGADRRRGWCCSSPSARTASSSTPTTTAARATTSSPTPKPPCSSTGRRSVARSASRATVARTTTGRVGRLLRHPGGGQPDRRLRLPPEPPVGSRAALDSAALAWTAEFAGGDVPRPEWWGGWRICPAGLRVLAAGGGPAPRPGALRASR